MTRVYIIMGVSGVGKTTIGKSLAARLKVDFYDADDFHPQSNIDKMSSGTPLTDEDRWPWLDILALNIQTWKTEGAVLACSALKESYRERLSAFAKAETTFVYLKASFSAVESRLAQRKGHFFDSALLQSQFDTIEEPTYGIVADATKSPEEIINQLLLNTNDSPTHIGLIGLGVMGKSLARNFAKNGVALSLYNRRLEGKEEDVAINFIKEHSVLEAARGFEDIKAFVESIPSPRNIFLMVNAGTVTDIVIASLLPHLEKGDLIMDGGNSHFQDTNRRVKELERRNIAFLGIGVSGGEEGALKGPSIMPGGNLDAYNRVAPILEKIAARDINGNACCVFVGNEGAGHYVKMLHNGIEYGEMQLITEIYDLMRFHQGLSLEKIEEYFSNWNEGDLGSYLLEISAKIAKAKDDDTYLLDVILDKAAQKGTGGWSTTAALEIGQPFDTIVSAVMARNLSSFKMDRVAAGNAYKIEKLPMDGITIHELSQAYQAARIINHVIGFETIKTASRKYNWGIDVSELARIWTNGCIIRSRLMEQFIEIHSEDEHSHTLLHGNCQTIIQCLFPAFAKVVSAAAKSQAAIPVLSSAYNYFIGFVTSDSATHMIQAQRDFFGAHTYERKDKDGNFHTHWENNN